MKNNTNEIKSIMWMRMILVSRRQDQKLKAAGTDLLRADKVLIDKLYKEAFMEAWTMTDEQIIMEYNLESRND